MPSNVLSSNFSYSGYTWLMILIFCIQVVALVTWVTWGRGMPWPWVLGSPSTTGGRRKSKCTVSTCKQVGVESEKEKIEAFSTKGCFGKRLSYQPCRTNLYIYLYVCMSFWAITDLNLGSVLFTCSWCFVSLQAWVARGSHEGRDSVRSVEWADSGSLVRGEGCIIYSSSW